MNRPALLPWLILLGLGLYFFLQQFQLPILSDILYWPAILLIIIGLSFIICSFSGWDKMMILPGGILLSLGILFLGYLKIFVKKCTIRNIRLRRRIFRCN